MLSFSILAGIVAGGDGAIWRMTIGALFLALVYNGFSQLSIDPLYQQITLSVTLTARSRPRRLGPPEPLSRLAQAPASGVASSNRSSIDVGTIPAACRVAREALLRHEQPAIGVRPAAWQKSRR